MNRPIHFEIPAEKPERAMKFYEKVFGWKFEKWGGPMEYWVVRTGDDGVPGINGGLMTRRDPAQPCVNTMDVPDLDATLGVIESAGGQCVVPKMPVPGVGWLAYFKDTEGHIFGAMQPDPAAK
jgi:predicted enzyme related to lactoylglutathione lyase